MRGSPAAPTRRRNIGMSPARDAARIVVALLSFVSVLAGCGPPIPRPDPTIVGTRAHAPESFSVRLETSQGPVVVEVHRDWAPRGADRFFALVQQGFYDGQRFFRVRAGYIAQFGINGDPAVARIWKGRTMADDSVRVSNVRGTLAYAMTGPNTRTTQIYINLADNLQLDAQGFAPFAKVSEGMDVVDKLYSGYGESAGGGMRGGRQEPMETGGNAYLALNFPRLDYIIRATVVKSAVLVRGALATTGEPYRGVLPPAESFSRGTAATLVARSSRRLVSSFSWLSRFDTIRPKIVRARV